MKINPLKPTLTDDQMLAVQHPWAKQHLQRLKEINPEFLRDLKKENELEEYLAEKVLTAQADLEKLKQKGLNPGQALELVWGQLTSIP